MTIDALRRVESVLRAGERRVRLRRALEAAGCAGAAALLVLAVVVVCERLVFGDEGGFGAFAGWLGGVVLAIVAVAYAWRTPREAVARRLDRDHGLADRLASAVAFGRVPEGARTPMMRAAIDDAASRVRDGMARHTLPIRIPRATPFVVASAALLAVASQVAQPHAAHVAREARPARAPLSLADDEIDAIEGRIAALATTPEGRRPAFRALARLADDLRRRPVDREELFRRLRTVDELAGRSETGALRDAIDMLRGVAWQAGRGHAARVDRFRDIVSGDERAPRPRPGVCSPRVRDGEGAGDEPAAANGPEAGEASRPAGHGDGHLDPRGRATEGREHARDTHLRGASAKDGVTRSEAIVGAAERGFFSDAYRVVYTEYRAVAESSLAPAAIPPGYRFYIRRYFELIRPRS